MKRCTLGMSTSIARMSDVAMGGSILGALAIITCQTCLAVLEAVRFFLARIFSLDLLLLLIPLPLLLL